MTQTRNSVKLRGQVARPLCLGKTDLSHSKLTFCQTTLFGKNWPLYYLFIYFFTKVDVVMICKCFIIASSLTLIFYLSLLFWILKIASSLGIFLHLSFFLMDVGNHIVLDFNSLFVFVCMSVRDHIVLDPHFSFVFILIDVGNLIVLDIGLLFVFVHVSWKWKNKKFVY